MSSIDLLDLTDAPVRTRSTRAVAGLENQGATCYLSSLLQTLYHTPALRKALYEAPIILDQPKLLSSPKDKTAVVDLDADDDDAPSSGPAPSLPACSSSDLGALVAGTKVVAKASQCVSALQRIFHDMETVSTVAGGRAAVTKPLTNAFGWSSAEVRQQQDIQELARKLTDNLEAACAKSPLHQVFRHLFEGRLVQEVRAPAYGFVGCRRVETFRDLQLGIEGCNDMQEALKRYCAEEMTGRDQYLLEGVGKVDAVRQTILRPPPVLHIQLNRFRYVTASQQKEKLNSYFAFPEVLDLTEFVDPDDRDPCPQQESGGAASGAGAAGGAGDGGASSASSARAAAEVCAAAAAACRQPGKVIYHLHTVVVHSGTVNSGHYWVYVRPNLRAPVPSSAPSASAASVGGAGAAATDADGDAEMGIKNISSITAGTTGHSGEDAGWFEINDSVVSPSSSTAAVTDNYGDPEGFMGRSAYYLVYVREEAIPYVMMHLLPLERQAGSGGQVALLTAAAANCVLAMPARGASSTVQYVSCDTGETLQLGEVKADGSMDIKTSMPVDVDVDADAGDQSAAEQDVCVASPWLQLLLGRAPLAAAAPSLVCDARVPIPLSTVQRLRAEDQRAEVLAASKRAEEKARRLEAGWAVFHVTSDLHAAADPCPRGILHATQPSASASSLRRYLQCLAFSLGDSFPVRIRLSAQCDELWQAVGEALGLPRGSFRLHVVTRDSERGLVRVARMLPFTKHCTWAPAVVTSSDTPATDIDADAGDADGDVSPPVVSTVDDVLAAVGAEDGLPLQAMNIGSSGSSSSMTCFTTIPSCTGVMRQLAAEPLSSVVLPPWRLYEAQAAAAGVGAVAAAPVSAGAAASHSAVVSIEAAEAAAHHKEREKQQDLHDKVVLHAALFLELLPHPALYAGFIPAAQGRPTPLHPLLQRMALFAMPALHNTAGWASLLGPYLENETSGGGAGSSSSSSSALSAADVQARITAGLLKPQSSSDGMFLSHIYRYVDGKAARGSASKAGATAAPAGPLLAIQQPAASFSAYLGSVHLRGDMTGGHLKILLAQWLGLLPDLASLPAHLAPPAFSYMTGEEHAARLLDDRGILEVYYVDGRRYESLRVHQLTMSDNRARLMGYDRSYFYNCYYGGVFYLQYHDSDRGWWLKEAPAEHGAAAAPLSTGTDDFGLPSPGAGAGAGRSLWSNSKQGYSTVVPDDDDDDDEVQVHKSTSFGSAAAASSSSFIDNAKRRKVDEDSRWESSVGFLMNPEQREALDAAQAEAVAVADEHDDDTRALLLASQSRRAPVLVAGQKRQRDSTAYNRAVKDIEADGASDATVALTAAANRVTVRLCLLGAQYDQNDSSSTPFPSILPDSLPKQHVLHSHSTVSGAAGGGASASASASASWPPPSVPVALKFVSRGLATILRNQLLAEVESAAEAHDTSQAGQGAGVVSIWLLQASREAAAAIAYQHWDAAAMLRCLYNGMPATPQHPAVPPVLLPCDVTLASDALVGALQVALVQVLVRRLQTVLRCALADALEALNEQLTDQVLHHATDHAMTMVKSQAVGADDATLAALAAAEAEEDEDWVTLKLGLLPELHTRKLQLVRPSSGSDTSQPWPGASNEIVKECRLKHVLLYSGVGNGKPLWEERELRSVAEIVKQEAQYSVNERGGGKHATGGNTVSSVGGAPLACSTGDAAWAVPCLRWELLRRAQGPVSASAMLPVYWPGIDAVTESALLRLPAAVSQAVLQRLRQPATVLMDADESVRIHRLHTLRNMLTSVTGDAELPDFTTLYREVNARVSVYRLRYRLTASEMQGGGAATGAAATSEGGAPAPAPTILKGQRTLFGKAASAEAPKPKMAAPAAVAVGATAPTAAVAVSSNMAPSVSVQCTAEPVACLWTNGHDLSSIVPPFTDANTLALASGMDDSVPSVARLLDWLRQPARVVPALAATPTLAGSLTAELCSSILVYEWVPRWEPPPLLRQVVPTSSLEAEQASPVLPLPLPLHLSASGHWRSALAAIRSLNQLNHGKQKQGSHSVQSVDMTDADDSGSSASGSGSPVRWIAAALAAAPAAVVAPSAAAQPAPDAAPAPSAPATKAPTGQKTLFGFVKGGAAAKDKPAAAPAPAAPPSPAVAAAPSPPASPSSALVLASHVRFIPVPQDATPAEVLQFAAACLHPSSALSAAASGSAATAPAATSLAAAQAALTSAWKTSADTSPPASTSAAALRSPPPTLPIARQSTVSLVSDDEAEAADADAVTSTRSFSAPAPVSAQPHKELQEPQKGALGVSITTGEVRVRAFRECSSRAATCSGAGSSAGTDGGAGGIELGDGNDDEEHDAELQAALHASKLQAEDSGSGRQEEEAEMVIERVPLLLLPASPLPPQAQAGGTAATAATGSVTFPRGLGSYIFDPNAAGQPCLVDAVPHVTALLSKALAEAARAGGSSGISSSSGAVPFATTIEEDDVTTVDIIYNDWSTTKSGGSGARPRAKEQGLSID